MDIIIKMFNNTQHNKTSNLKTSNLNKTSNHKVINKNNNFEMRRLWKKMRIQWETREDIFFFKLNK